jgi:hypothetical protein
MPSPRLREDKLSRGIPITFSESHHCISVGAVWISPLRCAPVEMTNSKELICAVSSVVVDIQW